MATTDRSVVNRCLQFIDLLASLVEHSIHPRDTLGAKAAGTSLVEWHLEPKWRWPFLFALWILVHRTLEKHDSSLPRLVPLRTPDMDRFLGYLESCYSTFRKRYLQLEYIFDVQGVDFLVPLGLIASDKGIVNAVNDFIEETEEVDLEKFSSDVIGYVYEGLISQSRRKSLGQYYTPPKIAKLICHWAIRNPNDRVLDAGCGSGVFLIAAYHRLIELKTEQDSRIPQDLAHSQVLEQLVGVEINPDSVRLAKLNLALRNLRSLQLPKSIFISDFFDIDSSQEKLLRFSEHDENISNKAISRFPLTFECAIGNPPYTRGRDIPKETLHKTRERIGRTLERYGLSMVTRAGIEPSFYMHFLIHAASFIDDGTRLSLLVPDSWLQTSTTGVRFQKYLLNNFKIHAIVDFASQLFQDPEVTSCTLFLEKCSDTNQRNSTSCCFAYIDRPFQVDDVIDVIEGRSNQNVTRVNRVIQSDLPLDDVWIGSLMNMSHYEDEKMIPLGSIFEVTRGTISYCAKKNRGTGANPFFYLNNEDVQRWGLQAYTTPVLTRSQHTRCFTFMQDDWNGLKERNAKCWLFNCNLTRERLPSNVVEYIQYGESECRAKGSVVCSKTQACKARAARKSEYAGWYDLGGTINADLFVPRYIHYRPRFTKLEAAVALNVDLIAFSALKALTDLEVRALLAYLNSSLVQRFIELKGRTTAMGLVALEPATARRIPLPNLEDLGRSSTKRLAEAFDKLERAFRMRERDGGSETQDAFDGCLWEIDYVVAGILGIDKDALVQARTDVQELRGRRLGRRQTKLKM